MRLSNRFLIAIVSVILSSECAHSLSLPEGYSSTKAECTKKTLIKSDKKIVSNEKKCDKLSSSENTKKILAASEKKLASKVKSIDKSRNKFKLSISTIETKNPNCKYSVNTKKVLLDAEGNYAYDFSEAINNTLDVSTCTNPFQKYAVLYSKITGLNKKEAEALQASDRVFNNKKLEIKNFCEATVKTRDDFTKLVQGCLVK